MMMEYSPVRSNLFAELQTTSERNCVQLTLLSGMQNFVRVIAVL